MTMFQHLRNERPTLRSTYVGWDAFNLIITQYLFGRSFSIPLKNCFSVKLTFYLPEVINQ